MPVVKASAVINALVEKVYDYVKNGAENGPVWIPQVAGHRNISPREPQVGQTWEWTYNMMGVELHGQSEMTLLDENKSGSFKTSGDATSTWLFMYEPEGQGTRVTVEVAYEIPGKVVGQIANRVVLERMNQKNAEEGLANLKLILES